MSKRVWLRVVVCVGLLSVGSVAPGQAQDQDEVDEATELLKGGRGWGPGWCRESWTAAGARVPLGALAYRSVGSDDEP